MGARMLLDVPRMTPEAKLGLTYIVESSLSRLRANSRICYKARDVCLCIFIFGRGGSGYEIVYRRCWSFLVKTRQMKLII